jgi:hypothetical protein
VPDRFLAVTSADPHALADPRVDPESIVISLALLAPEIVQSICDGSQPATLNAEVLKHNATPPTGMDQTAPIPTLLMIGN